MNRSARHTEWGKQARRLLLRRHSRTTGAWLLGALAPLAACGDNGEPPPRAAQVTDSAGIQVVTSPPNNAVYATVAPQPVLSVGVLEGPDELMFGRVASAALDGAGHLVVADGQSNEIRVFDRGGSHLRTFGGAGEGPGEFETLTGAWPTLDGVIVAVDNRADRITRFGPEGELLSAEAFRETGLVRPIGLAGPTAVLSRVRVLPSPNSTAGGAPDLAAMAAALEGGTEFFLRHGLDGVFVDTVAALPAATTQFSASGSGNSLSIEIMQVPFSANPVATASAAGRIAVTGGSSYEYSLYGPTGVLERIVRLAEDPPIRTEAHLEAWARGASPGGESWSEAEVRAFLGRFDMPIPDRLPTWDGLVIADNGQLWARRYAIRGAETIVRDVFDADGSHLGTVTLPSSFGRYVEQVMDDRIVAIATDDLGVERVQIHELR